MSDENDLNNAVDMFRSGKRKEAAARLLDLYPKITNTNLRWQLIDTLLSSLDPIEDNAKLIKLSDEGIKISKALNSSSLQAHFMAKKANYLITKVFIWKYQRDNLKLSPEWIEFSVESDKKQYEELSEKIDNCQKEIDALLFEATELAENSGDRKALAHVLMSKGDIEGVRYLECKADYCIKNSKSKWWLKVKLLRRFGLEYLFIFDKEQTKELKHHINSFRDNFLRSAMFFEEISDPTAGFVYCNLANELKMAYRFREAKKYLAKAEIIARKHNDILLLQQVEIIKKSIKAKNEDIPNYIEGERDRE